ncbi:hypothetical protein DFH09DRAFT_1077411 [Mycena vulgaris]|nr:hypothetical protein DFH09DRAFT_1077411 [Mycena vulgaris]
MIRFLACPPPSRRVFNAAVNTVELTFNVGASRDCLQRALDTLAAALVPPTCSRHQHAVRQFKLRILCQGYASRSRAPPSTHPQSAARYHCAIEAPLASTFLLYFSVPANEVTRAYLRSSLRLLFPAPTPRVQFAFTPAAYQPDINALPAIAPSTCRRLHIQILALDFPRAGTYRLVPNSHPLRPSKSPKFPPRGGQLPTRRPREHPFPTLSTVQNHQNLRFTELSRAPTRYIGVSPSAERLFPDKTYRRPASASFPAPQAYQFPLSNACVNLLRGLHHSYQAYSSAARRCLVRANSVGDFKSVSDVIRGLAWTIRQHAQPFSSTLRYLNEWGAFEFELDEISLFALQPSEPTDGIFAVRKQMADG